MYPPYLTTNSKNAHLLQLNAHDQVLFSYGKAVAGYVGGKFVRINSPLTRATSRHIKEYFGQYHADELVDEQFFRDLFGVVKPERITWPIE